MRPVAVIRGAAIRSKAAYLVSFATPFIGNPDMVERLRNALPISPSDPQTYYQGDARGYIDYPLVDCDSFSGI